MRVMLILTCRAALADVVRHACQPEAITRGSSDGTGCSPPVFAFPSAKIASGFRSAYPRRARSAQRDHRAVVWQATGPASLDYSRPKGDTRIPRFRPRIRSLSIPKFHYGVQQGHDEPVPQRFYRCGGSLRGSSAKLRARTVTGSEHCREGRECRQKPAYGGRIGFGRITPPESATLQRIGRPGEIGRCNVEGANLGGRLRLQLPRDCGDITHRREHL
mmetsp:Transcript_20058/g.50470  ORF Transcript_20058/g.50470 Transcript_20058/m.50470 type:complete len:218 (-) Transcript_20058:520-1173(-)